MILCIIPVSYTHLNVSPIMAQDYKMNIVSIAMRSFHFMFRANTFPEREKCDLLIEPYLSLIHICIRYSRSYRILFRN